MAKLREIKLYSDTLWKTPTGNYFRMWVIITNRAENIELTNQETKAEGYYTEDTIKQWIENGKLTQVWE